MLTINYTGLLCFAVIGLGVALYVALRRLRRIEDALANLCNGLSQQTDAINGLVNYWNTQLEQAAQALNACSDVVGDFLHHIDGCCKYILTILRPTLQTMQRQCVKNDDFEEAAKCAHLIQEIDEMITYEINPEEPDEE